MGASVSRDQFLTELSKRVQVESIQNLTDSFMEHRQLDDEQLHRQYSINIVRLFDTDSKDQKIGEALLGLSDQDISRPSEQRRMRRLLRRRQHTDLEELVQELQESNEEAVINLLKCFPPLHPCDKSVDTQLSGDVLSRLGVMPHIVPEMVYLIVKFRRNIECSEAQ